MFHREFGDLDVLVYRSALNKVYVYFSTKYYNVKKQLQIFKKIEKANLLGSHL